MTDDTQTAERYLTTFALIAPLGLFVALVFEPLLGGILLVVGVAAGTLGLHRIGRRGTRDRL